MKEFGSIKSIKRDSSLSNAVSKRPLSKIILEYVADIIPEHLKCFHYYLETNSDEEDL